MGFFKRESKGQIRCAHILVNTETEAQQILNRLSAGEDFKKIAKKISKCPSGKREGDLGKFSKGKMVKEFEDAAFALNKGEVSSIVKTQFGFHNPQSAFPNPQWSDSSKLLHAGKTSEAS